ncbi:MAG: hypothetical protein ACFCUQ_17260 [Kiloniellales bacterium]
MNSNQPITHDLHQLAGMVARANAEIAAGGVIDLAPLEARVRTLCAQLDQLPADEAGQHRDSLVALLDDLTGLERRIAIGLEALAGELGQTSKRREAVAAYANRPNGDKT